VGSNWSETCTLIHTYIFTRKSIHELTCMCTFTHAAGTAKTLVQGVGGMRPAAGGKKAVQSKLIEVASVSDLGPEVRARTGVLLM
jgi:hypothetical protein